MTGPRADGIGGKTVLVAGGGRYQRALIRRAKELGLRVAVADGNPHAPGLALADVPLLIDFRDTGALRDAAAAAGIDGVTTVQAERAVPAVARLADELGLPGIGDETARLMTNKLAMRRRLAEAAVPQPRFAPLPPGGEATVGFPAVVKPADASGQHGVARVESTAEVAARLPEALACSRSGEALIEEHVEGLELNGIVVVLDREPRLVTLCDRLPAGGASFGVSALHVYPSALPAGTLAEAERVAAAAARALGLVDGIAFPQLIATADGRVVVVECAARIGGMMAEHVLHARGVDLLEVQLRIALGASLPDDLLRPRLDRPVAIRFLTASPGTLRPGRVVRVGPLEPARSAPGVLAVDVYATEGELIRPVTVISDRRGYVIATGGTRDEALERADAAAALIEIEVEEEAA